MTLQQLILEIESDAFTSRMNLASNRPVFYRALATDPAVSSLIDVLTEEPDNVRRVLERIEILSRLVFDYRYENPNDAALAAYGWAIAEAAAEYAPVGAELLLRAAQTWWAREVADTLLRNFPASIEDHAISTDVSTPHDFVSKEAGISLKSFNVSVGNIMSSLLKDVGTVPITASYDVGTEPRHLTIHTSLHLGEMESTVHVAYMSSVGSDVLDLVEWA